MINIESPYTLGQEVFYTEGNQISKVKIRGAVNEPQPDGTKKTIYLIIAIGRVKMLIEDKIFESFEEAKQDLIKQEENHIKFAEEKLNAVKSLENNIESTPETVESEKTKE